MDSSEVQALLCLLKVLDNVHQDIPLTGALLSPIFGIEADLLAKARRRNRSLDLYDALTALDEPPEEIGRAHV